MRRSQIEPNTKGRLMEYTVDKSETRLCVNCRHFQIRSPDYVGTTHYCLRGMSLVTGEPEPIPCSVMRSVVSKCECGPSGKLFEMHPDK